MLEVRDSNIPNAGKGLFTTMPIKKGAVILEYQGEKISWKECQKRNQKHKGMGSYYLYISAKNCIDAEHTLDSLGRYANDAEGYIKIKGLRNNAEYQIINKTPFIVAKKNIKAGEEILVGYGKEYWKVMKHYFNQKSKETSEVVSVG